MKPLLLAALLAGASFGEATNISVTDCGAKGDGNADDTTAIHQCSLLVGATGGSLYFPAGTYLFNPAAAPIVIRSNVRFYGPGTLKVKPDAGDYDYIFRPDPFNAAVSNVVIEGLTIDQNIDKNTSSVVSAAGGHFQMVATIYGGAHSTDITYRNLTIYASGVNTLVANGPGISGVTVSRNRIFFKKRSGQPAFDNSAIYINGDQFTVSHNVFSVVGEAPDAVTAIEAHTGSGSITANKSDWYATTVIAAGVHDVSISGNTGTNGANGIVLWQLNPPMSGIRITDNAFSIANVTRGATASIGIGLINRAGVTSGISDLLISGNVVTYQRETAGRAVANYDHAGITLLGLGPVSNATICDNVVVNAPVRGIKIGHQDGQTQRMVTVQHNLIIDAGNNPDHIAQFYAAAIALDGQLEDVVVSENHVKSTTPGALTGVFALWAQDPGGSFSRVRIYNQDISAEFGAFKNNIPASVIVSPSSPW